MTSSVNKNDKLSRKEFLEIVSMNYKIPMKELEKSYNAIFSSLVNEVLAGRNVCLTGIGLFYLQKHKGHSVQFKKDSSKAVKDYDVLKFSASYTLHRKIRSGNLK